MNLDNSDFLSSDFLRLRNLCSLIECSSLCNLTGLTNLWSPISSKNFLILMVWTLVLSCEMDHQKYNFSLKFGTLLSEAVEASLCYFFENWLTKLKCPILRNIQILSSQPKGCFQLASEVFTFNQIQVHPVQCTHLLTPK